MKLTPPQRALSSHRGAIYYFFGNGKGANVEHFLHFREALDQIFPRTPPFFGTGKPCSVREKNRAQKNDLTPVRTQRSSRYSSDPKHIRWRFSVREPPRPVKKCVLSVFNTYRTYMVRLVARWLGQSRLETFAFARATRGVQTITHASTMPGIYLVMCITTGPSFENKKEMVDTYQVHTKY